MQRDRVFNAQNISPARHQQLQQKHVDKVFLFHLDVLIYQFRCVRRATVILGQADVSYKKFVRVKTYMLDRDLGIELNLYVADGREISFFQYGQYLQTAR